MKGWGGEDNFQETIQATVDDAVDWARLELELRAKQPTLETCEDCESPIPQGRRDAVPGCTRCASCQQDADVIVRSYYNRRGSKDSQIR